MDFHLPLPTLQHLAMVCIGKVTLDKEIRPLKKLLEVDDDNNLIYMFEVEKIVTPLEIPATVKHDLSDVITGMFRQVKRSLLLHDCKENECHEHLEQWELLYDVHGKLEVATIWERFFDSEVSMLNSLDLLLNLLNFVIAKELWYGLDAIVTKILSVACRDVNASFNERMLLSPSNEAFAFVYGFPNSRTVNRSLKTLQRLFRHHECVAVRKEALFVFLSYDAHRRLTFQFFGDYFAGKLHYELQNETDAATFFISIMFEQNPETIIDMFGLMSHEEQLEQFEFVSRFQQALREDDHDVHGNMFCRMLDTFLQWPLTHFFMPFLKFALPNMNTHEVLVLFSAIQRKIPERGRLGVVYSDLLVKYWQAIPSEVKEEFSAHGCNIDGCDHVAELRGDMRQLAKKNKYLSEMILTEMRLPIVQKSPVLSYPRLGLHWLYKILLLIILLLCLFIIVLFECLAYLLAGFIVLLGRFALPAQISH